MQVPQASSSAAPLRLPRWLTGSLSARIVTVFLLLLMLVQAASFAVIHFSLARNERAAISEDLGTGERALQRLLNQNAARLLSEAGLLATDFGFRSAMASGDTETLVSALDNHGERVGAMVSAQLDTGLRLRASTRPHLPDLERVVDHLAQRVRNHQPPSVIELVDGQPTQFVMVPMKAPVVLGWVLMGFRLDRQLSTDLRSISDVHLLVLAKPPGKPSWTAGLSTLPAGVTDALLAQAGSSPAGTLTLDAAGDEYSARVVPLTDSEEPGDGRAVALVLRSVDEALAPYRRLQWVLAGLTALGVLAFAIGSVIMARRVTTPIRRLATAAERLASGDYATPIPADSGSDEIGELAKRFERMRLAIADQQDQILRLAYWDRLTGLPNRLQFRDAAHLAISRGDGKRPRELAVIMLDLDRFKHVNEVLGYQLGDLLLKSVAERLAAHTLRDDDVIARLGADEFAVLLPGADADAARAIASRIAHSFETPLVLGDHTVDLGAGIGIACWPRHAQDADTLLSRAEVAMYAAKRRAQGAVMYSDEIDSGSTQTLSLLTELRHAIEHGELRLYLQPKIGLDDGRVRGAEALVRWQHPQRGMVPPMQFIPFAEQTGFVRQLTLWVFEEAARQWAQLKADGLDLRISVNLSTRDLLDAELPDKLNERLRQYEVPPEAFCLEITESAIMDDPARAEATLTRLNAIGFKLAIDDFGTGYSSLAYLKRLPVDELKIDKSFVLAMERDVDDAKIVRSTIDLAHNLGLSVVAEGVENEAVWSQLRDLHCDEAQGFYMSRPLPLHEFRQWCARWAPGGEGPEAQQRALTLH
jgi:diguanylate cyclase (GGDEF)-like protein